MKKIGYLLIFVLLCLTRLLAQAASFQQELEQQPDPATTGDIVLKPVPHSENALFRKNEQIVYSLNVRNNTDQYKAGHVSYVVTTDDGKEVASDSIRVAVNGQSAKDYFVKIAPKNTGFYRIQFIINSPDYDDTVRRVFGVDPQEIRSQLHKPADFNAFWTQSKELLEKVTPKYRFLERKDLSTDHKRVFAVEMHSLDNMVIRGWL